ncbi:hypothetical protein RCO48_08570 [Peribacillus frigoritolerans]|nr:hypothetical protein [Peribacillus frigoritolerans]
MILSEVYFGFVEKTALIIVQFQKCLFGFFKGWVLDGNFNNGRDKVRVELIKIEKCLPKGGK